jgi:HAD superfamily hydrolase (TIGR01549 family)
MVLEHFVKEKPRWDDRLRAEAMGMSNRQFLKYFAEGDELTAMANYVPHFTNEQIMTAAPLTPGFKEVLPVLAKDYNLAICSNRESSIEDYLDYYELHEFFPYTITALDVDEPKPSPEGLIKICDHYGMNDPLFIGDTATDLATAVAAGVRFLSFGASVDGTPFIMDHRHIFKYL